MGALLDSRPVRALVKLTQRPPRLWSSGDWRLAAMDDDILDFTVAPGQRKIEVRGIGQTGPALVEFWKALGLDAATLTLHPDADHYETTASLDFTGRLVKVRRRPAPRRSAGSRSRSAAG